MSRSYLALGSNLENPLKQVCDALQEIAALPHTEFIQHSHWYKSSAIGPGQQPDFINGVCEIHTGLDAELLLQSLQEIEHHHHRVRTVPWGPRTLDIDILLYGNGIVDSEFLQIPHPRMLERNFVLYPLYDIAPDLILPNQQKLSDLMRFCSAAGLEKIDE